MFLEAMSCDRGIAFFLRFQLLISSYFSSRTSGFVNLCSYSLRLRRLITDLGLTWKKLANVFKMRLFFQNLNSYCNFSDRLGIYKLWKKKLHPWLFCKEGKSLSEWQAGSCNSREIYSLLLNEFQNVFNGRTWAWSAVWTAEQSLKVVYCYLTIYSPFSKAITCTCDGWTNHNTMSLIFFLYRTCIVNKDMICHRWTSSERVYLNFSFSEKEETKEETDIWKYLFLILLAVVLVVVVLVVVVLWCLLSAGNKNCNLCC